uniref:Uncharacterized protein n=1 Tax=Anguilla anguilla TaxID=7936 RepID=A0A0E9SPH2_ANGAN
MPTVLLLPHRAYWDV